MDTVLFLLHIRGRKPLLVFYFRVEENFARGKFREIPFAVDIIFAGGKFHAKSKFAKIVKIYSTRKSGVIQYVITCMIFGMLNYINNGSASHSLQTCVEWGQSSVPIFVIPKTKQLGST